MSLASSIVTSVLLMAVGLCSGAPQVARQLYPAGIDPRLCPSYPQCDNAILAEYAKNPLPFQKKLDNGELDHFFFSAPGYPVGLSPIQCPNYPFCS